MSEAQFLFGVASVAALSGNAHDGIAVGQGEWQPTLRLPVQMLWFPDGLIVARAAPQHVDLLGARIVSVEGMTPERLMTYLRRVKGGKDAYLRWSSSWIIHSSEALHALGIARRRDQMRLKLRLRDGRSVTHVLHSQPVPASPPTLPPQRQWMRDAWPEEAQYRWQSAIRSIPSPLYSQDQDAWFRMRDLPELDALYVQFRANMDMEGAPIRPFVAQVRERLLTNAPVNLILDLRMDTGGDNETNRALMREIAQRVPGQIYVLIGSYTYSAGIASAAAIKHDGGQKVVLVGEEVADHLRFWSERALVCLPASKICVKRNKGLWDLTRGCRLEPGCYGDKYDVTVRSLAPDIAAPITSRDWLQGNDPGLQAVIADVQRRKAVPAERRGGLKVPLPQKDRLTELPPAAHNSSSTWAQPLRAGQ
jgi:hypothetical protein